MKTPKLGQHFLTDEAVVNQAVAAAHLTKTDTVLEVGPGQGFLTKALLDSAGKVVAIEKDGDLHFYLKRKFKNYKNLELVLGDVRQFDFGVLPKDYKIVANIPYYLTGQLIQQILTAKNAPQSAIFMLQNEVADRLTAPPGQSNLLQLTSQVFAETEKVMFVPRAKFNPPPAVDSALVALRKRAAALISESEQGPFFRILKFAFAGKRKKITNTLAAALALPKSDFEQVLEKLSLSKNARPQELGIFEWLALYKHLRPYMNLK